MGQGRWRAWQSHDHPNSSLEKSATFSTTKIIPNTMDCQLAFVHQTDFIRLHSMFFLNYKCSSLLVKKDTNLPTIIASKCQFRHLFWRPLHSFPHKARCCQTPCFKSRDLGSRRSRHCCAELGGLTSCAHEVDGSYTEGGPVEVGFLKKNVWNSKIFGHQSSLMFSNLLKGIHKTRSHIFFLFLCSQVV